MERGEINLGNKNKCCREAMVLAVKGWSKEDLYDHGRINYAADEMMPSAYEEIIKSLKRRHFKSNWQRPRQRASD